MNTEDSGTTVARQSVETLAGGESISALAMLGKTAFALVVVIAVIFLFAWLVRRFNLHQAATATQYLKVVGSLAVGQRERVVLVEVDKTWLVLGVGNGQVTRLHKLHAPTAAQADPELTAHTEGFANRLARSLSRHTSPHRNEYSGETPP